MLTVGQTVLYINKYYEKSLTSGNATSYYFLGGRLIGMKEGAANVTYVHQDHLTGTSVVSDSAGSLISSIAYAPFGSTRAGSVSTDIQFTGQRLDSTGLYFYNARYYDPMLGRFISADSIVPDFSNPQALNRYAYVVNNPLKYTDPSGHWWEQIDELGGWVDIPDDEYDAYLANKPEPKAASTNIFHQYVLYNEMQTWVDSAFTYRAVSDPTVMLDMAGTIPVVGEAADLLSGIISAVRGDLDSALLSLGSMVPILGSVKSVSSLRKTAVNKAWKAEKELVESTGKGTKRWTEAEKAELSENGRVSGYVGHHINSIKGHVQLAGEQLNVAFVKATEHLKIHGGNWRNPTNGPLLNR